MNFIRENSYRLTQNRKLLVYIIIAIFIFVGLVYVSKNQFASVKPQSSITSQTPGALKRENINREFEFPLKDKDGKEVGKIKYGLENAELRKEILISGKKATAVSGRVFLILNIKVTNSFEKTIEISTKDYVRVSVGNSTEQLAADINNDPVKIQPISTKLTRLGFPVNEGEKKFKVFIGEISGEKTTLEVTLN
ncbi:hypothetical protein A3F00_00045 [Candidatus Daviesbacteria bacterium RIFCSPHIGHO2_12_FULL_37_11]|uniref:DUF4352 domain-containing protein n=1 Tax=Candidatus Daviesbacteria bacterium RIFCSPHIGHO2_12_FULL_37_11 TaxID=1797777 RepID=A0A1F5KBR7_9BACT|nr:MAG: hypothetical protein A2769_01485 [Candidatus Daviesbacteria bacterium RIFCSPHIGHO2_01_FULL_37_27]OGE38393.1 MAG: hypothetical protein A3F00_00045 [Candidatus Daviesbacteria bacterium RIFCSPHIGHO2_12_FULL_37_11]